MFATMFLGVVLGVFLTLGVVRGDAERGLLQPLLVRPLGRTSSCSAASSRPLPSAPSTSPVVYAARSLITGLIGDWWPDRIVLAGARARLRRRHRRRDLAARLGVPFCDGERDRRLHGLRRGARRRSARPDRPGPRLTGRCVGRVVSWALPFEALYQDGLHAITENTAFAGSFFGSGPSAPRTPPARGSAPGSLVYAIVVVAALTGFARRDL